MFILPLQCVITIFTLLHEKPMHQKKLKFFFFRNKKKVRNKMAKDYCRRLHTFCKKVNLFLLRTLLQCTVLHDGQFAELNIKSLQVTKRFLHGAKGYQNSLQIRKNFKDYYGSIDLKIHHRFSDNAYPLGGISLSLGETWC